DAGSEIVEGGPGADTISGGGGIDMLFGGELGGSSGDQPNTIHGDDGNDIVIGGDGNDVLYGDAGDDMGAGNQGDDTLVGGGGKDALLGMPGNDTIDAQDNATDGIYGCANGVADIVHRDPSDVTDDTQATACGPAWTLKL